MANTTTLPATHRALVQETYAQPLVIKHLPTPQPVSGTAIIRVLYAPAMPYTRDVYDGTRNYKYPTPLTTGAMAVGRVAAVGPDAVLLKPGDLVYTDSFVRGRDDAGVQIIVGVAEGGTPESKKLMAEGWREGAYSEYFAAPLENVFKLDEKRVCREVSEGGLGLKVAQLGWIFQAMVPFGGLRGVGVQPGETVLIAPATGGFGSAGVPVALAMGASVVAMGRNEAELAKLKALSPRVKTVQIADSLQENIARLKAAGPIDVYLDLSPRMAQDSTHFKAGIMSLRPGGRVALMGGFLEDVVIPHRYVMRFGITLKGVWMYERQDNLALVKLLETGLLDIREVIKVKGIFKFEDWKNAFDKAMDSGRLGEVVVLEP